ncbi:MAG: dihydropteroate synthase [Lachnospiraceae bacterium]|nr:dihydropteroate synthase [Lachnospiraceae bacterium]
MKIGKWTLDTEHKVYMMGILNVTPDSFSDGGRHDRIDQALYHAEALLQDGADILDIGGESTRPDHVKISCMEEIQRVCPVIEAVKARMDVPVSLDTYKSRVAQAGIQAGADMINDIWGLKWDGAMAGVIAESKVSACLMHNRKEAVYTDFLADVSRDLKESLALAEQAGVDRDRICIDPGIGFAKTLEQNLFLMRHLEDLQELGYPVLLGTSRKSMIGLTLDLPVDQREEGTIATTVLGIMKGCSILRVHDVKGNLRAARMTLAMLQAE